MHQQKITSCRSVAYLTNYVEEQLKVPADIKELSVQMFERRVVYDLNSREWVVRRRQFLLSCLNLPMAPVIIDTLASGGAVFIACHNRVYGRQPKFKLPQLGENNH